MKRVVITGMGAVSPLGNDVNTLWENISAGQSGVTYIEDPAFAEMDTKMAAQVKDFDGGAYLSKKDLKVYDLAIQYGYAAALQAIEQAALSLDAIDLDRAGVYIGSGAGGLGTLFAGYDTLKERGARRVSPFLVSMSIANMVSGVVAMKTGFRGASFSAASACATGNHSIGEAYHHIAHGYADLILAGGAEAPIHPLYFAGFNKMKAMSRRNEAVEKASRPFDVSRDGFVMGEGAGVLLLESYEHAVERGAHILAEIVGYGATTDAYHMTSPHYEGAAKAMQLALERADLEPEAVDYINAHGTSTPTGDISEVEAINQVFGQSDLKVSSTKSMTGHLFGAAGGIEAIITTLAIGADYYPPSINIEELDPLCKINVVKNNGEHAPIEYAMSNGFGFGGHNAVLLLKKYREQDEQ
ncbi:MAG TPA: beta-ketoacyl-ACP synthase II [Pseudogracilibacillus sp.]|nr:beta-ketoacyl-ACP synthase II [Pseudogracilibacillus sp.]